MSKKFLSLGIGVGLISTFRYKWNIDDADQRKDILNEMLKWCDGEMRFAEIHEMDPKLIINAKENYRRQLQSIEEWENQGILYKIRYGPPEITSSS